jgi:hypothetical protein
MLRGKTAAKLSSQGDTRPRTAATVGEQRFGVRVLRPMSDCPVKRVCLLGCSVRHVWVIASMATLAVNLAHTQAVADGGADGE